MLPGQSSIKTIRDAQRAKALAFHRDRLHAPAGAGPSSSKQSGRAIQDRRPSARLGVTWTQSSSQSSKASKAALKDEVSMAKGHGPGPDHDVDADLPEDAARVGADHARLRSTEVPLDALVVPGRAAKHGDFELVRSCKNVIVLDDDHNFGSASVVEQRSSPAVSASSGSGLEDDDDEWELLDADGETIDRQQRVVKTSSTTWASIVQRA